MHCTDEVGLVAFGGDDQAGHLAVLKTVGLVVIENLAFGKLVVTAMHWGLEDLVASSSTIVKRFAERLGLGLLARRCC